MSWSTTNIPSQAGKLALVTGATGGLGYETALELARAGADVVLTGRNAAKGSDALVRIRAEVPKARVSYEDLDLSALGNVKAFAEAFGQKHDKLDILVNNAGVMAPPSRETTRDGFELQFETNYLSHFALTARLLPLLQSAPAGRVVPLASVAARQGKIDFANLQAERSYNPMTSYSQTKLACLMFGFELQRRSDANGWGISSITAHPGVSAHQLDQQRHGGLECRRVRMALSRLPLPAGTAGRTADPVCRDRSGGEARRLLRATGLLRDARRGWRGGGSGQSLDVSVARRLWDVSEELSGVRFPEMAVAA